MPGPALQSVSPRLKVGDVRRPAEWYRDRLGFEIGEYVLFEGGRPGFVIVRRQSVEIQLTLAPDGEAAGNPAGTRNPGGAYFHVHDIDALYRSLQRRGVAFLYELESFSYGMRVFGLLDCDGHYLGFGEPVGCGEG